MSSEVTQAQFDSINRLIEDYLTLDSLGNTYSLKQISPPIDGIISVTYIDKNFGLIVKFVHASGKITWYI
jgi:hypothetical protein